MEKGFNDDELADIMSEIENLEKEFSAPEDELQDQFEEEEVFEELSEMPQAEAIGEDVEPHDDQVHRLEPKTHREESKSFHGAKSSMSFNVEGDMKLDLSFNISGKTVHLNISEHCFELEFGEGMKFSIPVDQPHKKAA